MPDITKQASQGLKFRVLEDGSCEVAGLGSCKDTDIVIPADDGEGHKVTRIGDGAFSYCTGLTDITIPDSVTEIGDHAFARCTGLRSVTIGNSVTNIDEWAFADCTGLTSIIVDENNTVYHSAGNCLIETESKTLIMGCKTSVIPNDGSVTSIGNNAFDGCTGLTNITIPDSVTEIGEEAFRDCTGLTRITIPNSVTCIDVRAFSYCTNLETIRIPDCNIWTRLDDDDMNYGPFMGCDNLRTIVCSHEMAKELSSDIYGLNDNIRFITPEKYADATAHTYTVCVFNTGEDYTLHKCSSDTPLLASDLVQCSNDKIGVVIGISPNQENAEMSCRLADDEMLKERGFTQVTTSGHNVVWQPPQPETVEGKESPKVDTHAAKKDPIMSESKDFLFDVVRDDSVPGGTALQVSRYLGNEKDVVIPDMVDGTPITSIGKYAFAGNTSLQTVTLPDSVDIIEHAAFEGCRNLQGIDFPVKTITLDQRVFEGCDKLPPLNEQNFFYRYDPFDDHHVDIPDVIPDVIKLDNHHVDIPNVIPDVILPQGVKMIGEDNDDPSLNMPNVERKASQGLEFKVLDDGTCEVAGIGSCMDTDIVIPADDGDGHKVTRIGDWAFQGCTGLTSVTIPDGVTSIGEWAFGNCLELTSITIPDSVTSIGGYAFFGCYGLTNITIPDSVTSIGEWAFADCTGLTNITIPDGVTEIPADAFAGCTELTNITIPDSVTRIVEYAFDSCYGLTNITIPESVTSIGERAFGNCLELTSITIPNSVTSIGDETFKNCRSLTSITIPDGVTSIGPGAFSGCTELTSITIPDGVTYIDYNTFESCTNLTSVTLPDRVERIGSGAFLGCTSLTNVTLPDSVESIGSSVFRGCTNITSVAIPDGVTRIDKGAFDGCDNLQTIVCSAEMKDELINGRGYYGLSDNVKIFASEEYAAKQKDNGPSLDDD